MSEYYKSTGHEPEFVSATKAHICNVTVNSVDGVRYIMNVVSKDGKRHQIDFDQFEASCIAKCFSMLKSLEWAE